MNPRQHTARLDGPEYVIRLTDELLKFVDDADDREALREIGQQAVVDIGGGAK